MWNGEIRDLAIVAVFPNIESDVAASRDGKTCSQRPGL
jgi:hypothetical protein